MWNDSETTARLGIDCPIIQGPFGGGLSTSRLVAAVSNAGGLGSFGAHVLAPLEIERMAEEIRTLTRRPFALNLWVSNRDDGIDRAEFEARRVAFAPVYEELGVEPPDWPEAEEDSFERQAEAVLRARPRVFSFVFGIPARAILEECRRLGIVTIGAATTVEEALAIEEAGVDMVVATGFEAGGHRPSFLRRAEDSLMGTMALVAIVRDRARIPVIAAGGIANGRGVAAALALGAGAVQLGTAFLACEESGASATHRDALFGEGNGRTILSRAMTGRLARYLINGYIDEFESAGTRALPYPAQGWLTEPMRRRASELGRRDRMALYASQATPLARHRTVAALMGALAAGVEGRAPAERERR